MNINTSLPIIHFFLGLLQVTAATLTYLTNRKSSINRLITGLLLLSSLGSFGFAFQSNALTSNQALPWLALEIFSTYSVAIFTLLFAFVQFTPNVGRLAVVKIGGATLVSVPLILMILDLLNLSVPISGSYFLINIAQFNTLYTPGHIGIIETAEGFIQNGLIWIQHISYGAMAIFPLLFVIWRERRDNEDTSIMAVLLLFSVVVTEIANLVNLDFLPNTVPQLIATAIFLLVLANISFRNAGLSFSTIQTLDNIFRDVRMLYKILLLITGIVLPSIIFMSFSIYTLLFDNTVENTTAYLDDFAATQSDDLSSELYRVIQNIGLASQTSAVQALIQDTNEIYAGLGTTQIDRHFAYLEENQEYVSLPAITAENQPLFTSLMLQNPLFSSLTLVDRLGGLIGSSDIPDQYDLRESTWWQHISTEGSAYVGTPFWDEEIESYAVTIAIPTIDTRGQFIGGVELTYSLNGIMTTLSERLNLDIYFGLNVANNTLILSANQQNLFMYLPARMHAPETMANGWTVVRINNNDAFLTSTPINIAGLSGTFPWELASYQLLNDSLVTLYRIRTGMIALTAAILVIVLGTSYILARGISNPISSLNDAAQQVLGGNLDVQIQIAGEDELGVLGTTFSQMTSRLSGMVNTLESTVDNRTRDLERRTLQMETSARVARQAAEIRDLQTLLNESVNLITDQFGYYHTGIFLLDSAGRYAVLQAASSPGGQRMLARGHRLQVGKVGVVGYCAGTGLPRISQDVGADIVYYDNPDMPRTRSELALPLRVRNAIIGVLDVQSSEASAFAQEDINILQTLADQIALAIDNVRLLQSSQRALDELQRLYGQQAGQAWRQKLAGQPVAYQFSPTGIEKADPRSTGSLDSKVGFKLNREIRFRGQSIGKLNLLRDTDDGNWSEDEQALIDEILEQTALALENARLVDQIRLRSDQIQLLQEISAISTEILDEEKLIPILASKLQSSLAVEHCGVILLQGQTASLVASANTLDHKPQIGTMLEIENDPISQRLVRTKEVDVIIKTDEDSKWKVFNEAFGSPLTRTMIFLPIIVRDQTAGFFYLEDIKEDRQSDLEEYNLFNQISTQVSTALENIRLFDETVNRAERERQVAEITAKIRSSNDPQEILQIAVAELKHALNPQPVSLQEEKHSSVSAPTDNGKDVN